MAKIGLPNGSGKRLKVSEKSGNFEVATLARNLLFRNVCKLVIAQNTASINFSCKLDKTDLLFTYQ